MTSTASPPIVLSFAGTDPTGGAGLQADVLTLSALGCHPLSVATAVTVQDTAGVEAVLPLDPQWVTRQAQRVLADIPVQAFKIGVVGSAGNAEAIAGVLAAHPGVPVVLDPVLASGRGDALSSGNVAAALRRFLLPRTTLVTPNSIEARALAREEAAVEIDSLAGCARRLIALGVQYVLVTGTHEPTEQVTNTLYGRSGPIRAESCQRLPAEYHGSGCTLASACAAFLAKGLAMEQAISEAQAFTWRALAAGFQPGRGQHLPDRAAAGRPERS